MRRTHFLAVLMIPLLLLAGCGAQEAATKRTFASFREELIHAQSVTACAALTADSGESIAGYVLEVAYDGAETSLTITEPALLAGVTARVKWGESTLVYEDVMLGAGPLDKDGLTPVSAIPAILEAMAGGYEELIWRDGDYVAARLYVSETSRCTVWIDPETYVPVTAEISSDGQRVISCTFTNWALTPGGE